MERPTAPLDNVSSSFLVTDHLTTARPCYLTPEQRVQFYNQAPSMNNQESPLQNHDVPPQPITTYIDQALQQPSYSGITTNTQAPQQPSYSGIASNNIPQPRTMNILKLKIIPPFNKDHFATKETFETASNQCIASILRQFSPQLRTKLTISKTFTMVGTRRLHTFHIVAPIEATDVFSRQQSSGIEMLGRTVIPQSDSFERYIPGIYPKHIPVRILQLPSLCHEQEIHDILGLPDYTEVTSLRHNTGVIDGITFYNGRASAMVRLVSKEHEQMLREWSIRSHENGTHEWNGIPIYAFIPSLHACQHCKDHHRPFHGHDIAWCRYAKADEQPRTTPTPNNGNQEISAQPSNNVSTSEPTAQTDETNVPNVTPDETSDSNQDQTDNQEDTETNSEDDDSQRPWQTAPTHSTKTLSATKTQSQPSTFDRTKRKHNQARLFTAQNLKLQMPAPKKKKKPTK